MRKTVLITGGVKGIGRNVCKEFAQQDVNLIINYRSDKRAAEAFVKELSQFKSSNQRKIIAVQADVSIPEECSKISDVLKKNDLHSVDILIHNAGPFIKERKRMAEYTLEEWNKIMNGNLSAVFCLSKLVIPMMRNNKWGRIITYGFDRVETAPGWMYRSVFAAAKSGAASLTKTLALEEAEHGITVNMVCPGDIIGEWKERTISDAIGKEDPDNPIGRPGTGEDIARMILFLCDPASDFITGSVVPITGGKDVLGKVYRQQ
ncbi:SDR family oxidoreductase [Jeotgalibacillus sp. S-D1]|uniref:SDR family oxidoreductase n=1 Tax=Jeotgalibacillus sp. S-D1 TaxID=2552189 RepID=UPI00105974C1|nr:SDR family oxidoreductase [Jeotgalibacillus sp. S-D1]TDL34820.1 SDR family oxidoreductase [Jeotgalibacillus sp. S-D1]